MPIDQQTHAQRRRAVMDRIGPESAALFVAAPVVLRSHDTEYRHRQDSDFYYLTGVLEPDAVCLLLPAQPEGEEFVLFVQPRDPERESWAGARMGVEGAVARYGANVAYTLDELDEKILAYVGARERLYCCLTQPPELTARILGWLRQWRRQRPRSGQGPVALCDPSTVVHELRLFKDEQELAAMRRAAAIAAAAHLTAMRAVRPGVCEYEIEALLDYTFRKQGAWGPAYPSIVASGSNATVLHYTANDRVMQDGDLVLIDAGAEFEGYCSDITRTYPVGPDFSGPQRDLYELVLHAQLAAIEMIRPGVRVDEIHQHTVKLLVEGLVTLGVLAGNPAEIIEKEEYKQLYLHRTSHWLGLDVHDAGLYKIAGESRLLEPGMVLTVEPGIYAGNQAQSVAAKWSGIGVRIEDDVLVTAAGHEVLSAAVPKSLAELAAVRRWSRRARATPGGQV
ncbi:MAG: aminopeptidase P N-terminal domain-containing protein [Deltaproteobacteria bacterium]|nr:aminopeptidase P N-terminal domain-containing protein [Deltaproteobacteria bacterium]